jgi:hypothetical protein
VLKDSLKMVPDCRKRLELAVDDLAVYIVSPSHHTTEGEDEGD